MRRGIEEGERERVVLEVSGQTQSSMGSKYKTRWFPEKEERREKKTMRASIVTVIWNKPECPHAPVPGARPSWAICILLPGFPQAETAL